MEIPYIFLMVVKLLRENNFIIKYESNLKDSIVLQIYQQQQKMHRTSCEYVMCLISKNFRILKSNL